VGTLRVLFLDAANRLIADEQVAQGTVSSLCFHPREVIRQAIACDASAMILVHNHPRGLAEPSPEDIDSTEALAGLSHELGIILHDHLILAEAGWFSMRQSGHV
jgi:DNA repair protein RadC